MSPYRLNATWVSVSSLSCCSSASASSIIFCSLVCRRWLAAIASSLLSTLGGIYVRWTLQHHDGVPSCVLQASYLTSVSRFAR